LALSIIQFINEVPGVTDQSITVVDYIQAEMLNNLLKTIYPTPQETGNNAQKQGDKSI
jgi:hypothetical protein